MNDLRGALLGALNSDISIRQRSETLLKAAQKQPEVIRQLPAFFGDADPVVRKLSSIFYKNAICEEWRHGTYVEHKRFFVDNLLYVVMQCDCNLVSEVEKVIECILENEAVDELGAVYAHALALLQSVSEREFGAALVFFKRVSRILRVVHHLGNFEKILQPSISIVVPLLKDLLRRGMFAYAKWVVSILTATVKSQCKFFNENINVFEAAFQTVLGILNLRIKDDTIRKDSSRTIDTVSSVNDNSPQSLSHAYNSNEAASFGHHNSQSDQSNYDQQYHDRPQPMHYEYLQDFRNSMDFLNDCDPTDPFQVVRDNQAVVFIDASHVPGKFAYARTGGLGPGDQLHLLQAACADFLAETFSLAGKRHSQGAVSSRCLVEGVIGAAYARARALLGWHVPLLACEPAGDASPGARPRDRLVKACTSFVAELVESKALRRCVLADALFVTLGVAVPLLRFGAADAALFHSDPPRFLRDRYSLYAGDARAHAALLFADMRRRLRGNDKSRISATLFNLLPPVRPDFRLNKRDAFHPTGASAARAEYGASSRHGTGQCFISRARTEYAALHCLAASDTHSYVLVPHLLTALSSEVPFLRAQACHCLQYCRPEDLPLPVLSAGLDLVLSETSSTHAVLCIDALAALSFFFPVDGLKPRLEGAAPALVRQLLDAQACCEVEAIGTALEGLIAHFPAAVGASAPALVSQLCTQMHTSIGNGDEDLVHTHQAYLRTIQGLVFAFQPRAHKKEQKSAAHPDEDTDGFQNQAPTSGHSTHTHQEDTLTSSNASLANIDLRNPFRVSPAEAATSRALAMTILPFYVPILRQIFQRKLSDFYEEALQLLGETAYCLRNSDDTIWELTQLALSISLDDRALFANDLSFALENIMSFGTPTDIQNHLQSIQEFYVQMTALEDSYADGDDDHSIGVLGMQAIMVHLGQNALPLLPSFLASATAYQDALAPKTAAYIHLTNFITASLLLSFNTTADFLSKNNNLEKHFEDLSTNITMFARVYDVSLLILLCTFLMSNHLKDTHCLTEIVSEQENHFLWVFNQITANSINKNLSNYNAFSTKRLTNIIASILMYALENLPESIENRKKAFNDTFLDDDDVYFKAIVDEEPFEETFIDYIKINGVMKHCFNNLNEFGQNVVSLLSPAAITHIRKYLQ